MGRIFKDTYQLIKINVRQILLFELVYRMVTIPAFLWLMNRMIRLALKAAGYSYVTVSNLVVFFFKPVTLLCVLVIGLAGLILLLAETGGLITAFQAGAYHRRVSIFQMMAGGALKSVEELKKKNWRLLLVLMIHDTLTNCFIIYRVLIHVKLLKFILPGIMGEPVARLLLVMILAVFVCIAIPTAFVCYGCMVEQKGFTGSVRRSRQLIKGRTANMVFVLVFLNVSVILAGILGYLAVTALTAGIVVEVIEKNRQLATLVAASGKIEFAVLLLGSAVSMIVNYGALTVMYFQFGNHLKQEEVWDFDFPARGWLTKRNFLTGLGVLTAFSLLVIVDSASNGFAASEEMLSEIQITAHRGSSGRAPENTMAALEAAYEDMADYAEIDVQETKDGLLVVCHDTNLKRLAGVDRALKTMTAEELEQLDVGGWFSDGFKGTRIPSLEKVLEYCKGRLKLNIEIKSVGKSSGLPEKVAGMVEAFHFEEQCVITSTSLSYLKRVKEYNEDLKTGYIVSAAYGDYYLDPAIDFISIRSSSVTEKLILAAHENGKEIHAWTVNKKNDIRRMLEMGVDNLITDYPVTTRAVIYQEIYQEEKAVNLLESIRTMLE